MIVRSGIAAVLILASGCTDRPATTRDMWITAPVDPAEPRGHDLVLSTTLEAPISTRVLIREYYSAEPATTRHQDTLIGAFAGDIASYPYWADEFTVNVCEMRAVSSVRSLSLRTGRMITITTECPQ